MDDARPPSFGPPPPPRVVPAPAKRRSFWRSPAGVLSIFGLTVAGAMFLSVLALGLALELGYFPDTVAVEKEDFPDHALRTLREAGIVADGEDVLYFYGGGMFDYLEDGNLFTDRRVVSYWSQGGEVVIEAASYAEVADISADYSDNMWVDSEVTVTRSDGTEFLLVVSTDEGGDRAFVRSLEREWRRRR